MLSVPLWMVSNYDLCSDYTKYCLASKEILNIGYTHNFNVRSKLQQYNECLI